MKGPTEQVYNFWAQRGRFRWANPNWIREGELLQIRKGSAHLFKPRGNVSGQRRAVVFGAVVIGSLMGGFDWWLLFDAKADVSLGLLLIVLQLLAVAAGLSAEERTFWRFVARHSPAPGLAVHIERVEYGWYRHRLVVRAQGDGFGLTVFGLPSRVRSALATVRLPK